MFENREEGEYWDRREKCEEAKQNSILMNFIICTLRNFN
jgi:hypothetical protein